MNMLTTNLLPQEDKKTIELVKAAKLTRAAAVFICGFLVANAVLVLPTLLPLLFERKELKRELATGQEAQQKFQVSARSKELKALAATLREIRVYASQPHYPSKILDTLANHGNAAISLETITVTQTGDVLLNGKADTRKALLEFESTLRNSPYLNDITSPLSNIIRESNISFSIQGNLKPGLMGEK
ncbi:MAG: hypothetical protein A2131_01600 [Candidatus Sungbacteria bacterium GWC2_49_10]|uniref:Fimbrial assembly family protein n=2 Tax=Parcubacteria group TaxID=1794811 RepID=A0A0G1Z0I0_9BACT|nr:MAG: hypothetical protein UY60_C0011G0005 [Parcubacteria group bacterium GW2011_GWB1_50_9]KKW20807.1 MAG: hypothetical protein UY61_C0022G0004 [Candidatus Adlerbacteria bacterium GW2011_GWC1_50_9]OGZ94811.1 MAG: hypothetical protein A2131_01600 [Candidatus Sungbacteria bacterium GWC2_49_10]